MVVQDRYKLVVDASNRPTHLFDLVGDAHEQENLAGQRGSAAITEQLQAVRRRWAWRTADRAG
jgi:hypothetical protein